MKNILQIITAISLLLLFTDSAFANVYNTDVNQLSVGISLVVVYGVVGIILALVSYKLIDAITPGKLGDELREKQNVALAIVVGSMILGICIIIAAAIAG